MMRRTEFISQEHIAPELQSATKADAFVEFTGLLPSAQPLVDVSEWGKEP